MGFLGIYKAVYDYEPQGEGELSITDGDLLYVLEKDGEDDWWKAKKRANADDDDEPVGLVPNNYVEEVGRLAFLFILPDDPPAMMDGAHPTPSACLLSPRDPRKRLTN
jgi:hypothetical protein